jgi:hypothetical protein
MENLDDLAGGARVYIDLDGTMLVSKSGSPSEAVSFRVQIADKDIGVRVGYPSQLRNRRSQVANVAERKRTDCEVKSGSAKRKLNAIGSCQSSAYRGLVPGNLKHGGGDVNSNS